MKRTSLLVCLLFLLNLRLTAQDGTLDNTFGSGGIVTLDVDGTNDVMNSVLVQPDGKILVSGYVGDGLTDRFCIMRFNEDGSLDNGFGNDGITLTEFGSTAIGSDMALLPDGKIIVSGHTWGGTQNEFVMARYAADGQLDETFGTLGKVSTPFQGLSAFSKSIAIQTDGKIVLGGSAYTLTNDFDDFAFARYLSDGTLDASFGNGGMVVHTTNEVSRDGIFSLTIQPDGKIVAAGFSDFNAALLRLLPDGTLDAAFGSEGIAISLPEGTGQALLNDVIILNDGNIIGAGFTVNPLSDFTVFRYTSSGQRDVSFGADGAAIVPVSTAQDGIASLQIQADNKLVVGGMANNDGLYGFALTRLNADGTLDPTFGSNGSVITEIGPAYNDITSIALDADSRILAVGWTGNHPYDIALVRYNATVSSVSDREPEIGSISVYPNPSQDRSTLIFGGTFTGVLQVFDLGGKLMLSENISGLNSYDLILPEPGLYQIRVTSDDHSESFRIINL